MSGRPQTYQRAGTSFLDRLEENMTAAEIELDADEIGRLDGAVQAR